MKKVVLFGVLPITLRVSQVTIAKSGDSGSRVTYGGGHHTASHGGIYFGGQGSSHRGETYRNSRTVPQYGTHK